MEMRVRNKYDPARLASSAWEKPALSCLLTAGRVFNICSPVFFLWRKKRLVDRGFHALQSCVPAGTEKPHVFPRGRGRTILNRIANPQSSNGYLMSWWNFLSETNRKSRTMPKPKQDKQKRKNQFLWREAPHTFICGRSMELCRKHNYWGLLRPLRLLDSADNCQLSYGDVTDHRELWKFWAQSQDWSHETFTAI